MWNTSGLDSHGGGYMMSGGFGESPTATQGANDSGRRIYNVVPTSICGILNGLQPDDAVLIGKEKIGMVILIGLITSVEIESTLVTIKIDDTTGPPLTVKQWIDREDQNIAEIMKPLVENCYVRVAGSVRTTNGEPFLVALSVTSLSTVNELTHHLLEIAVTKKLLEKGVKSSSNCDGTGFTQRGNDTSFSATSGAGGKLSAMPFSGGSDTISGLNPQQQKVFQAIRSYMDENGCSMEFLIGNLKGISQDTIRKTVALLSDEGHIYSTIDDDHFKATES